MTPQQAERGCELNNRIKRLKDLIEMREESYNWLLSRSIDDSSKHIRINITLHDNDANHLLPAFKKQQEALQYRRNEKLTTGPYALVASYWFGTEKKGILYDEYQVEMCERMHIAMIAVHQEQLCSDRKKLDKLMSELADI